MGITPEEMKRLHEEATEGLGKPDKPKARTGMWYMDGQNPNGLLVIIILIITFVVGMIRSLYGKLKGGSSAKTMKSTEMPIDLPPYTAVLGKGKFKKILHVAIPGFSFDTPSDTCREVLDAITRQEGYGSVILFSSQKAAELYATESYKTSEQKRTAFEGVLGYYADGRFGFDERDAFSDIDWS